jgi:hypothetical protein
MEGIIFSVSFTRFVILAKEEDIKNGTPDSLSSMFFIVQ